MKVMSWQTEMKFIKETLEEIITKNGKPTLNLHEDHKQLNFKQLMKHIMDGLREPKAEHNTAERGVEPKDIDRRISKTSSA